MPLVHHELCFGCGRTNLFGLLADLERREDGSVSGRCFIKQDHQGPEPRTVHPGLVACALIEAMTHAAGHGPRGVEVRLQAAARVGGFMELEATAHAASATAEGAVIGTARSLGEA